MLVGHYFEFDDFVVGGIAESVRHQRLMLDRRDIDFVTRPTPEIDLLHLNVMGPRSLYYTQWAQKRGIPVVMHTHMTAEDFRESIRFSNLLSMPLRQYLMRSYSAANRLICPSEYNKQVIKKYTDTSTVVISNGIDRSKLAGYEPFREVGLSKYNVTPPVVFTVRHVFRRKGVKRFVETARELPGLDFIWFGPINRWLLDRSTKQLIDSAPPNCTFTGYVDDIRIAYGTGDIFFYPTHEENEGIPLLEAMATENAILVRDIEPFSWLEDGRYCLKANNDFAAKIEALTAPELRRRLTQEARSLCEGFSISSLSDKLEQCYESVVTNVNESPMSAQSSYS